MFVFIRWNSCSQKSRKICYNKLPDATGFATSAGLISITFSIIRSDWCVGLLGDWSFELGFFLFFSFFFFFYVYFIPVVLFGFVFLSQTRLKSMAPDVSFHPGVAWSSDPISSQVPSWVRFDRFNRFFGLPKKKTIWWFTNISDGFIQTECGRPSLHPAPLAGSWFHIRRNSEQCPLIRCWIYLLF